MRDEDILGVTLCSSVDGYFLPQLPCPEDKDTKFLWKVNAYVLNSTGDISQNTVISKFAIINISYFNVITFAARWCLILRSDYNPLSFYCRQCFTDATSSTLGKQKRHTSPITYSKVATLTFRFRALLDSKHSVSRSDVKRYCHGPAQRNSVS